MAMSYSKMVYENDPDDGQTHLYEGMTDSNGRYLKDGYMMRQPAFTSNPE
jgi:hypothetical protein